MKNNRSNFYTRDISKTDKLFAFVIVCLVLLSCSPVILTGFSSVLIVLFVGLYFLFFINYLLTGRAVLKERDLGVFIGGLLLFVYMAIPFREFDRLSPSVIWALLFCTIIYIDKKILKVAFYYFSNIIYIICICALIVLFLNALGIELPSITIARGIGGQFTSYFIAVKLSGQDYSIFGINLYRLNGIFAEPGHFGLLLCMVLFAYDGIVKTLKGKVILLSCLLTFSFGSIILLLGLVLKNIIIDKKYYLVCLILLIIGLSVFFVPEQILERFFFDKAEGSLGDRTSSYFINFYNSYYYQGDVLLGNGRDILEVNNIRNSDYRGFVIRYGYVGVLLYIFLLISMFWKKPRTIQFLGIFYFAIVFLHRSWFIDYFAFLFFLLILSNYEARSVKNK